MIDYVRRAVITALTAGLLFVPSAPAGAATRGALAANVLCTSEQNPAYAAYMSTAMAAAAAASEGVTIGFYDRKTDTTCYTDPLREFKTASIVKVVVAVALHLRAQREARDLTDDERGRVERMITESSNRDTQELWRELHIEGPYITQAILVAGMVDTHPGPDGFFGDTTTTALDQVNLLKFLTSPNEEALEFPRRNHILELMSRVIVTQRYGVPVGAPSGATWSNKIGYANLDDNIFNYTTHSIGAVRGTAWNLAEHDYVMALLSNRNFFARGIVRVSAAAYTLNQAKNVFPG
jgi:hypothetical protein